MCSGVLAFRRYGRARVVLSKAVGHVKWMFVALFVSISMDMSVVTRGRASGRVLRRGVWGRRWIPYFLFALIILRLVFGFLHLCVGTVVNPVTLTKIYLILTPLIRFSAPTNVTSPAVVVALVNHAHPRSHRP